MFLILGAIVYSTAYRVSFFGNGTPAGVINTKVGIDSNNVPLTPKVDQVSPQGPIGPLDTKSGGVPAGNPRGETPPGMQSGPGATPSTAK